MRGVLINCIFMILCCGGKNLFRRLGCHLKSLAFFLLVNIYVKLYITILYVSLNGRRCCYHSGLCYLGIWNITVTSCSVVSFCHVLQVQG